MAELLRMGELVERAGVERSTIQHYLREGLLPQPAERPHRNMAYYSADLVERIALVVALRRRIVMDLVEDGTLATTTDGS